MWMRFEMSFKFYSMNQWHQKSVIVDCLKYWIKNKSKASWNKQGIATKIDVIQAPNDPLEVLVGPVTRLRAKGFKIAFNRLLQDMWANVDLKRILNNEEKAMINLIQV